MSSTHVQPIPHLLSFLFDRRVDEVDENTRNTIIHHWHLGQSQRQIARGLHVSRNTVKAVLEQVRHARSGTAPDPPLSAQTKKKKGSLLDSFESQIANLLARYPYITIVDLLKRLQSDGYQGSYTILRERVKRMRQNGIVRNLLPNALNDGGARVGFHTMAVDIANAGRRKVQLFVFQLLGSGRTYMHFSPAADLAASLFEHTQAFDYLGGVAVLVQYERTLTALQTPGHGSLGDAADTATRDMRVGLSPLFIRFANHYGFRPAWVTPESGGGGEYVTALLDRLRVQLLSSREYRTLDHLNDALRNWLAEVADRLPYRGQRPSDRYPQELEQLIPLPAYPWSG